MFRTAKVALRSGILNAWKPLRMSGFRGLSSVAQPSSDAAYDVTRTRNCAIIAHVDHGKTTLMDKLLEVCGTSFDGERAMDSNEHEKERGITITSKYTRLHYDNYVLHVVDTPGHADFSGEVERILSMVDGVILLVDASEGPMAQTKFVLSKAIANGKKAIVVLNKVDREGHRAEEVQNEIFDLFCALTSDETLLDYPLLFASARQGWVVENIADAPGKDVFALMNMIIKHFPYSAKEEALNEPFALSVNSINYDPHLGRIVTGKVESGKIAIGDPIHVLGRDGTKLHNTTKVTKLFYQRGLTRVDVDAAYAGQIVSLAGSMGHVADTVCNPERTVPVPTIPITPPVISMAFAPNDSPLAGKDGARSTSNAIKDRLRKEIENNVTISLRESATDSETLDVQGRGELQIGILIETLRREGYELMVSPPRILTVEEDGVTKEPFEEVIIDTDPEYQGVIIENMSNREGNMIEFKDIGNRCRMIYHVPSRGLIGFRYQIVNATRGNCTVNTLFSHYAEVKGDFYGLRKHKIISMETGKTTSYALDAVQERGSLFVGPGEEVYEGMVIGESAKPADIDVNPCKEKKLTNIRAAGADEAIRLIPPKKLTLEEMIAYMDSDEVLEVTPKNIRLRKRVLSSSERARLNKASKAKSK